MTKRIIINEYLEIDPDISAKSPVVRGTLITVESIVSLIRNGFDWGDILKTHPELCEDDIRACLIYAIQ